MALRRIAFVVGAGLLGMTGCIARSADPVLDFGVQRRQGTEPSVSILRVDDPSLSLASPTTPGPDPRDSAAMRVLTEEEARTAVPVALLSLSGPPTKLRAEGLARLRLAAASVGADALSEVQLGLVSMKATAVRLPAAATRGLAR